VSLREGHRCASERLSTISEGVDKGLPITRIYGENGSFVLLDENCPLDANDYTGELVVVCLSCLLDQHPDVGHALDLANAYGSAHLADDEWVAD
jgi:hypothetical protein